MSVRVCVCVYVCACVFVCVFVCVYVCVLCVYVRACVCTSMHHVTSLSPRPLATSNNFNSILHSYRLYNASLTDQQQTLLAHLVKYQITFQASIRYT